MPVAGIDIGSRGAKGAVMEGDQILGHAVIDTGADSSRTSNKLFDLLLHNSGLARRDIEYVVATGYGRVVVPFANDNISEISCHARGAHWYLPRVRTILDMGGQDCKAISLNDKGQIVKFVMNDKCAGGTGRFLELIAQILEIPLEQIGEVSLQSREALKLNSLCALFGKSEALSLLKKGKTKGDILAGLHEAIANRCLNLLRRVSIMEEFAITGGIAQNMGMVRKLEEKTGIECKRLPNPVIVGAVGAALFAMDRLAA